MPYTLQERRDIFIPRLIKFSDNLSDEELTAMFVDFGLKYVNCKIKILDEIIFYLPEFDKGDMNYMMTWLIHKAVVDRGLRYTNLNNLVDVYVKAAQDFKNIFGHNYDVDGCYMCSMFEFIRRIVNPYEDKKIRENGAVSDLERELNPED